MRKNKAFFDALYNQYNRRGLLHPDPLEFLRQWPADVREREVGALLAACFAYGNVQAILKNLHHAPSTHIYTSRHPAKAAAGF